MQNFEQIIQTIQGYFNLILSLLLTCFRHYIYPGPPKKTWSLKFHFLFHLFKTSMEFQPGQLLTKIREKSDQIVHQPRQGYQLKKFIVPNQFRMQAYNLLKNKLRADLNLDHEFSFVEEEELKLELCQKEDSFGTEKTIFYLHGGAYVMCSINTHRELTSTLAYRAKAKLFSLNYRLAPEHPFPSALEDALAAYLFLTTSKQSEGTETSSGLGIDPKDIVVAGDSAGGGLAMSFTLLLRDFQAQGSGLGMVAGSILMSPWVDLTSSLPSFAANGTCDYLPGPDILQRNFTSTKKEEKKDSESLDFITSMTISASPQLKRVIEERGHFFVDRQWLKYHLVSPLFAQSFANLPPILITVGHNERLRDEAILLALKIREANPNVVPIPPVQLYSFAHMPHVFQLFSFDPIAKLSLKLAGSFIQRCHGTIGFPKEECSEDDSEEEEQVSLLEDPKQRNEQRRGWAWFVKPNFKSFKYNFKLHEGLF